MAYWAVDVMTGFLEVILWSLGLVAVLAFAAVFLAMSAWDK